MRKETVEREIKEYDTRYVAEDGTEFDEEYKCIRYEQECYAQTLGVKIKDSWEFYEGSAGKMYYIPSEEAYNYVSHKLWFNFNFWDYGPKAYRGPGWYLRIEHKEQDTSDWDNIYYMPVYLVEIENDMKEYKQSMYGIMLD